jgi:hypothetical protein
MTLPPHLLPSPAGSPPPRLRPADALRALARLLQQRGVTRLYGYACAVLGVLSITYGISVWSNGRVIWWRHDSDQTTWPAADPEGAARLLTSLTRPGNPPPPDHP